MDKNKAKDMMELLDSISAKNAVTKYDHVQFSMKMCIERSELMEDEGLTVFNILPSVSNDRVKLEEFCMLLSEMHVEEVSVSEYCFAVLWKLLDLGATVKETYVGNMTYWPSEFMMVRLSLKGISKKDYIN